MQKAIGTGINIFDESFHISPFIKESIITEEIEDQHSSLNRGIINNEKEYTSFMKSSAHGDITGWGFSISTTGKYIKDLQINSQSSMYTWGSNIILKNNVIKDISNLQLTEEAKTALKAGPNNFMKRYGSHFISGYTIGCNFMGMITISSSSISDKKELDISLNASYKSALGSGGSIGSSFFESIKKIQNNFKTDINVNINGGINNYNIDDVNDLKKAFDCFLSDIKNNPKPIKLFPIFNTWDSVDAIIKELNNNISISELQFKNSVLQNVSEIYSMLNYSYNSAISCLKDGTYVGKSKREELENIIEKINIYRKQIEDIITKSDIENDNNNWNKIRNYAIDCIRIIDDINKNIATIRLSVYLDGAFKKESYEKDISILPGKVHEEYNERKNSDESNGWYCIVSYDENRYLKVYWNRENCHVDPPIIYSHSNENQQCTCYSYSYPWLRLVAQFI
jgi:hypothetical protein